MEVLVCRLILGLFDGILASNCDPFVPFDCVRFLPPLPRRAFGNLEGISAL